MTELQGQPRGSRCRGSLVSNTGSHSAAVCEGVKQQFFKTQICAFYKDARCPFTSDNCSFAHDTSELRQPPDLTKTKLCPRGGRCRSPPTCQYAHSTSELRSTDMYFKSRLCKFFSMQQRCSLGNHCRFAHGEEELRDSPQTGGSSSGASTPTHRLSYKKNNAAPVLPDSIHHFHSPQSSSCDSLVDSPSSGLSYTNGRLSDSSPLVFTPGGWTALSSPVHPFFACVSPDLLPLQSDEPYED